MAAGCYVRFAATGTRSTRSAIPENPTVEQTQNLYDIIIWNFKNGRSL